MVEALFDALRLAPGAAWRVRPDLVFRPSLDAFWAETLADGLGAGHVVGGEWRSGLLVVET